MLKITSNIQSGTPGAKSTEKQQCHGTEQCSECLSCI